MRLLTIGSLPPEWGGPERGGAATFHAAILREMGRRDEVEIVGVLPPGPLAREIPVPAWIRPDDVGRARFYEDLLERLQPDVVLMSHIAHTVGVTHARLGSPVPALGVIHSWHNVTFRTGEERRAAIDVTAEALSGLGAAVTPSNHTLAEGQKLGFEYPVMVEAIHNPVPPAYMGDLDLGRRRRGVLFLGSLIPRKQPGALVEAAALLPGLDISLVGAGEEADALRSRIAALSLGARVAIAKPPPADGHVPWIRAALLGAGALCLPSRSEGLPLAFVEALACGTPIVGFGPAVREIGDELGIEVGAALEGDGPEEIAAAIERVLAADWDRDELRRATLAHFGLDRIADRYLGLLARLHGERKSAPAPRLGTPPPGQGEPAQDTHPICVLGPSRSGTSLTTRLLGLAGVYLGPKEELLGEDRRQLAGEGEQVLARAKRSNPDGHWEHYRMMRLNERILRAFGGSWREPPPLPPGWESAERLDDMRDEARAIVAESFGGHPLWAWKDPRNSLTLPFWQALLPPMRYVLCLRHPAEVADSLRRRDGIAFSEGVEQWTRYQAAALVNTSGRPRLLVSYGAYFTEPAEVATRLARFAGLEGAFGEPAGGDLLTGVVDERLWRSRAPLGGENDGDRVSPEAASLFRRAELLAASDEPGD